MQHYLDYRRKHPDVDFESRVLECADGVSRMLMLGPWYWKALDVLINDAGFTLERTTQYCLDLAHRAVKEQNWNFDHAFTEVTMAYIYTNYEVHMKNTNNIANEYWEDLS